jgi:site-specific recombinase
MFGLGIQELLILVVIGVVPIVSVAVVLFLVLRSRKADGPEGGRN